MDGAKTVTAQFRFEQMAVSDAAMGANVLTPQAQGAVIVFTSQGYGGSGSYEYQYLLKSSTDMAWTTVQAFSSSPTWTWNTVGVTPASYMVMVYVRNQGSLALFDMARTMEYSIVGAAPAKTGSFTVDHPSPQMKGSILHFTAQGADGSGSYEYQFQRKLSTGTVWSTSQTYSTNNVLMWDTSNATAGTYNMRVMIRNAGSPASYEALAAMNFSVVAMSPVTGATLTASLPSPQASGTSVIVTATSTGGNATHDYRFLLRYPGSAVWKEVQAYGEQNTWPWDTTGMTLGTYGIQVQVRNNGSAAAYEVVRSMSYLVTLDEPARGATITTSPTASVVSGATVTVTVGGTGGGPSYEYKIQRKKSTATTWTTVQEYATNDTIAWDTTGVAGGIYTWRVSVRTEGSLAAYEAMKTVNIQVFPYQPAAISTLTASPTGSQPAGSSIVFTTTPAAGSGTPEYRYYLRAPGSTAYTMERDYTTDPTWTWVTTADMGNNAASYTVLVYVRNQGSPLLKEATKSITYRLTVP
jgi:hypothetical protein